MAGAREMTPVDIHALPFTPPTLLEAYGKDPLEKGELRVPAGKGPFPVAVVIHGGCWTKGFDTTKGTAPIASALTAKGIATWNIEYRQIGDPGGGWPGSFQDWGAATDHLRALAKRYPLDLKRVIVVGHSAGAHAALWVAARGSLPKDSPLYTANPLKIMSAVAIDGPGDLAPFVGFDEQICHAPVITNLIGGKPADQPQRYHDGSPLRLLPIGSRQYLVSSAVLSPEAAESYAATATKAGDKASVLKIDGDHFNIVAPGEPQWAQIEDLIVNQALAPQ
jgi:acetyl esterase/lipase